MIFMIRKSFQEIVKKIKESSCYDDFDTLLNNTLNDWVMLHLCKNGLFINSFCVDNYYLEEYKTEKICNIDFELSSHAACYSEGVDGFSLERKYLTGISDSKLTPLVFHRTFHGYQKYSCYDILQDFIHAEHLFWMSEKGEKGAYCNLNELGDIEEKCLVINEDNFKVILVERKLLDDFLYKSNQFLVRLFNIYDHDHVEYSRNDTEAEVHKDINYLRFKKVISKYEFKGGELIIPIKKNYDRKYEDFIINDYKNEKIILWSSDPNQLDNYFNNTGKPFETSPSFFRADVLAKYRNNPDKYELGKRHINCRGAWSLKNYDVNEEGQVHTYIRYLSDLPYEEQLNWKSNNEAPKGPISNRAINTDFLGKFDDIYCPLSSIKKTMRDFPKIKFSGKFIDIWLPKNNLDTLLNELQPVISDNNKEYKDFLLSLTKLVIEGFQIKNLKDLMKDIGCNIDEEEFKKIQSIGILKHILTKWGYSRNVMDPLNDLQKKRSASVHGGRGIDFNIREDYLNIISGVDKALNLLVQAIKEYS